MKKRTIVHNRGKRAPPARGGWMSHINGKTLFCTVFLFITVFSMFGNVNAAAPPDCGERNECSRHGACSAEANGCLCDVGFTGPHCDFTQDLCAQVDCGESEGRGRCASEDGKCWCYEGWVGENCDINTCNYHGIYDALHMHCKCFPGFGGRACEECAPAPANHTLTCVGLPLEDNRVVRGSDGALLDDKETNEQSEFYKKYGRFNWMPYYTPTKGLKAFLTGHQHPAVASTPAPVLANTNTADEVAFFDCACNTFMAEEGVREMNAIAGKRASDSFKRGTRGLEERALTLPSCNDVIENYAEKNGRQFNPATATPTSTTNLLNDISRSNSRLDWFVVVYMVSMAVFILTASVAYFLIIFIWNDSGIGEKARNLINIKSQ